MQIYILNRARETLATTASIYNDKHTLTLEAGSSSYEFTIDKSDEASHYLDSGNYIVLQDDKGKTWLFTILDYEETHNTKTVYAEDAGIELINKAVDIWKGDGPHPFSYYFDLVTKGTPWELGVNQLAGLSRTLTYEGRDTGLGRLLSILKGFDNAECTFDVTVKMNAPAEFKINVYKQVGNDRSDVQIVYNNELNDITKKESRAEFVTALAGVGGQIQTEDGSEGGNVDFSELEYDKDGFVTKKGDKFLRAVDANRTFNPGQESYIESFYEYDTQSPSELLNRTLSKLKTHSEPQYTYTADVKVIDSSLVLGDTVTILDHDYNPALYLSARVAKLVKSYTDPAQNEIEFTNYRLLSSALADKLARLQVIVNALPSASRVSAIETNLTKLTKQQEEVIVKVESANGKNTNFYGGSQPESAKQGDSWFYTDEEGNQGIKQYQNGVWVDIISSKFGPKLKEDIKKAQADVDEIIRKANNNTTIFRTEGKEAAPTAKKKGDLWFKTDNGQTAMHEWDGQKWHEVVNTKTTDDIAKKVDQARAKMEELVKKANNDTTIFRTEGQEAAPTAKKKGDLWFKTDNGQTVMHEWDGQKWHEIVSTKTTEDIAKQVEQAQLDLAQVRADATRISETQTKSAKRLDEQMQELRAKTVDNATNVQNVIRDVAQAHADYVAQQDDISKQKADLEKTKQSLQTTSQNLDQARQDLLSNSTRINKLEVGVDGVTVNVNNLNTKVDNIKIGGTNLIRNGGNPKTTDGWPLGGMSNDRKLIVWSHGFWKNGKENLFALFNRDSNEVYMSSNRVKVERNTEYTLSYWAFNDGNVVDTDTFFLGRRNDETSDFTVINTLVASRQYSGVKAEYVTITFNTGDCDEGYVRFDNNGSKEVGKDAVLFLANIKLEKGNRATDYSPAPEDLIEKVVQFKVDLDGIRGTVANAQGDIAQIKLTENGMQQNIRDAQGNISTLQDDAKQFKQQFTDVDGNIANLSASAKTFELQMQDAQGNISSLQNDAKGFKQQFADTNGNIATIKRNATELSEQLASKVGNTEYQSFKTQTAKELSEKLVRTDLNGYATTAEVKLTADGLKEQYNSVNSKVNNLKIGGVNLIDNGGNPQTTDGWTVNGTNGDKFLRVGTHPFWKNSQEKLFILYNSDRLYEAKMSSNRVKVERNTDYTLSYWAFNDGHVVDTDTFFLGRKNGETSDFTKIFNLISKRKYSTSKAEYVTVTFNTGEADEGYIRFDNNRAYDTQCALYLANIQLEKGNVATDYGPSANDVANSISGVSKDLTNYKAVVERDYAKNSSVYTKNEVVNLTNNSRDSAVNAIKNDTNWKGLVNINTNSAFLQTADGFEKEVVKKATPLVEGGGVNLVRNSGNPKTTDGWAIWGTNPNHRFIVNRHNFWKNAQETLFMLGNSDSSEAKMSSNRFQVERNTEYTLSYWAFEDSNVVSSDTFFLGRKNGETSDFTKVIGLVISRVYSGAKAEYVTVTFNTGEVDEGYIRFDNNGSRNPGRKEGGLYLANIKLEKGTVATPWTPAPEDLATVVSVNKVIDTADSHTQIIKDYLTNDNSQFKLLKNAVNLKVAKGDVIGQINLEAGKTLLQNQKIYLDADTVTFSGKAFIPSAAISNLDAGKITTGTLNAAKLNVINLNANSINAGTLSGAHLHITKDSYIENASIDGAKIKSLDAGKITTGTLNAAKLNVINLNANAINAGTLSGEYLHITKQTSIDNGVIQGAKIADASIGTAKIADAAITSAKIANLDVNKLSGNKSTFVQSVWNGINNSVTINENGLITGGIENGWAKLASDGMEFLATGSELLQSVGRIHVNKFDKDPSYNGLAFDLDVAGDYMAWGAKSDANSHYITKLAWHKKDYSNKNNGALNLHGFTFDDEVTFKGNIYPTNTKGSGTSHVHFYEWNISGVNGFAIVNDTYSGFWIGNDGKTAVINNYEISYIGV